MTIELRSPAFREGDRMPHKFTCQGEDVSPPLQWGELPEATRSLAVVLDDPDAPRGVFTHWVLFNLPPDRYELPEHLPPEPQIEGGVRQGRNDFGSVGYRGPAPPPGNPHHYTFHLYALDCEVKLPPQARKEELLGSIQGHILDEGRLTAVFQRE